MSYLTIERSARRKDDCGDCTSLRQRRPPATEAAASPRAARGAYVLPVPERRSLSGRVRISAIKHGEEVRSPPQSRHFLYAAAIRMEARPAMWLTDCVPASPPPRLNVGHRLRFPLTPARPAVISPVSARVAGALFPGSGTGTLADRVIAQYGSLASQGEVYTVASQDAHVQCVKARIGSMPMRGLPAGPATRKRKAGGRGLCCAHRA